MWLLAGKCSREFNHPCAVSTFLEHLWMTQRELNHQVRCRESLGTDFTSHSHQLWAASEPRLPWWFLHMCSCFSTGTGWLLSHGFCWIFSLSVSWHQLFEWAPNVLPWDHWRQPEHINTQLLQWEDADSTSTQPEESRSFMGQIPPKLSFPIQRDLSIGASCSLPYRSSQKGFLYLKPFPFSARAHEEFLKGQCSSCAAV